MLSNIANNTSKNKMQVAIKSLNKDQLMCVTHVDSHLLILAGAGSGKTKTLITRLAYLIKEVGIPAENTLTLTFTNKAAKQMRQRALDILEDCLDKIPLLCTFHRFGLMFLKYYGERINLSKSFNLIDAADVKRIIGKLVSKNIAKEYSLSTQDIIQGISMLKNEALRPQQAAPLATSKQERVIYKIYCEYDEYLSSNNLIDFDDLILMPYEILRDFKDVREEVSSTYSYIMVDEYQDTNNLQIKLLELLCSKEGNLCVVGDDDQSIYGWRGANIQNILEFANKFNAKTIKLETNYRSTSNILNIANSLISYNKSRLGKNLSSFKGEGSKVEILSSANEDEEILKIAKIIAKLKKSVSLNDIAILFRLNSLSRAIELGLSKANIPHRLIGTLRFYERKEIKDLLAYIKLANNLNDNFSFERIINVPRRGIGDKGLQDILDSSQGYISVYDAYKKGALSHLKSRKTLDEFFILLVRLNELLLGNVLDFIDAMQKEVNVLENTAQNEDNTAKYANVDEFYGSLRDYFSKQNDASIDLFLEDVSLDLANKEDGFDDKVNCLSIHSSKGLEFKHVFVVGLEENFFPLNGEAQNVEEERRLGYVAFTRAMDSLFLSHVDSRLYKGKRSMLYKSRFLKEAFSSSSSLEPTLELGFEIGDCIEHKLFGFGRIVEISKDRAMINFGGTKRTILLSFLSKA